MLRLGEFRVCSGSLFQSGTAEGKKDVFLRREIVLMLADLDNYVNKYVDALPTVACTREAR